MTSSFYIKKQKINKFALDLQLQTIQILTDKIQILILSYFVTTVTKN